MQKVTLIIDIKSGRFRHKKMDKLPCYYLVSIICYYMNKVTTLTSSNLINIIIKWKTNTFYIKTWSHEYSLKYHCLLAMSNLQHDSFTIKYKWLQQKRSKLWKLQIKNKKKKIGSLSWVLLWYHDVASSWYNIV